MTQTGLDLEYPKILKLFDRYLAAGRTESHAFLIWFLENYYRLEEVDAVDAVCDGRDDKGVDGVYVDDNLEQIDVFQSKLVQSPKKTLGDVQLKEFYGSLAQFETPKSISDLINSTTNAELKKLLESEKVEEKRREGYRVRGVFVTNAIKDQNALNYMAKTPNITVMDHDTLIQNYVPAGPSGPVQTPVTFDLFGHAFSVHRVGPVTVVVAPVKAEDLIKLDGLPSGRLFAWNVRQSLGRTKVNREIGKSIETQQEHPNFLLYHNGLTILCEGINVDGDQIEVRGYSVVNGCQSLTSLYDNRRNISSDLRLLTRLIELSPDSDLAAKITHFSNNQNAVSARDLQSNSRVQRRLQNEFAETYPGQVFYRIKRGETAPASLVIDNEVAARILLAFDVKEPWACHQSYKLFDDLYTEIFARPEVDAPRILALYDLDETVRHSLAELDHRLMAGYRLTEFFLLYLLREALETDSLGRDFIRSPETFLNVKNGRGRLRTAIRAVLADLIIDLNGELKDRAEQGDPIDYKRELKSPNAVRKIARAIIPQYQKAVARNRASSFAEEWETASSA